MKKILTAIAALAFSIPLAQAEKAPTAAGPKFEKYVMDSNYFSCEIPADWELSREKEKDEDYHIYEIELIGPSAGKVSTTIRVSYYAADSDDFAGYQDFIDRNSKNVAGETKNSRENYGPVKEISLNGRKAFELSRDRLEYLHPESKSDESAPLKEKLYILPAREGFYVLHLSSDKDVFEKALPVFDRVVRSFKGRP